MHENIVVFNRFIAYAGLSVLLLGVVLMVFIGNSFAKPILQITDIAKRMSELDFDVKYPVTTSDEIGVLGGVSMRCQRRWKRLFLSSKQLTMSCRRILRTKFRLMKCARSFYRMSPMN